MNVPLFFNPVDIDVSDKKYSQTSLIHAITLYQGTIPDWQDADIVLIGVPEYRGNNISGKELNDINAVREKLYTLSQGKNKYNIVDLGDLKPGITREDTLLRLEEVCNYLMKAKVVPLIIGGTQDLALAQFKSCQALEQPFHLCAIDAAFDLSPDETPDKSCLFDILTLEDSLLTAYSHLAYQTYLVNEDAIKVLDRLNYEGYRIGAIRENIAETEPLLRTADVIMLDTNAIRCGDSPANTEANPFGLTAEETCQLAWYIGQSDQLRSFGIYNYHSSLDDRNRSAAIIAGAIWYFFEGFYNKVDSLEFLSNDYIKYVVNDAKLPHELIFFKSNKSSKWWMVVEDIKEGKVDRRDVLPCSYNDYLLAVKGEIPERWLKNRLRS